VFWRVHPRVEIFPSCPGKTGLTGPPHRSDRCEPWWAFSGDFAPECSSCSQESSYSGLVQFGFGLLGFLALGEVV
jgi:hypothetical protein